MFDLKYDFLEIHILIFKTASSAQSDCKRYFTGKVQLLVLFYHVIVIAVVTALDCGSLLGDNVSGYKCFYLSKH